MVALKCSCFAGIHVGGKDNSSAEFHVEVSRIIVPMNPCGTSDLERVKRLLGHRGFGAHK